MPKSLRIVTFATMSIILLVLWQNCTSSSLPEMNTKVNNGSSIGDCDFKATAGTALLSWDGNQQKQMLLSEPVSDDLDQDGVPEVLFNSQDENTATGVFHILSTKSGELKLGDLKISPDSFTSPMVADLDGDGRKEIVLYDREENRLVAFNVVNMRLSQRWQTSFPAAVSTCIRVSQIKIETGKVEIIYFAGHIIREKNGKPTIEKNTQAESNICETPGKMRRQILNKIKAERGDLTILSQKSANSLESSIIQMHKTDNLNDVCATPTPTPTPSGNQTCVPYSEDLQGCLGMFANGIGKRTCLSDGSGYGSCSLANCNVGYVAQSGVCVSSQTCTPNATQSCTVNGTAGTQTCDGAGAAWGACQTGTGGGGGGTGASCSTVEVDGPPWGIYFLPAGTKVHQIKMNVQSPYYGHNHVYLSPIQANHNQTLSINCSIGYNGVITMTCVNGQYTYVSGYCNQVYSEN